MTVTREVPAFRTQPAPAHAETGRGVELSIVIPAFNEEERLPASLGAISAYLAARPSAPRVEVLVVDDGSADATASRAEEAGRRYGLDLRVLRLQKNSGKGFAVRTGCLEAGGRFVLVTDADLSTPIYVWEKLAAANAPVAIGSRALDESLVKEEQPLYRKALGKLFNRLVRLVAVPGIRDEDEASRRLEAARAHSETLAGVLRETQDAQVEAVAPSGLLGTRGRRVA